MIFSTLQEHLEQYISDEEIGLEGIDSQTSEPSDQDYPSWLQEVAIKAMEKLVQYYPTSHGLAYIAGTGDYFWLIITNNSWY